MWMSEIAPASLSFGSNSKFWFEWYECCPDESKSEIEVVLLDREEDVVVLEFEARAT